MKTVDRDLLKAATTGDPAAIRTALSAGATVDVRDAHHRTPLLHAARGDHKVAAQLLVAAGANPNAQDNQRDSPWLVTGVTGSVEMMRILLPANPDPTLTNRYGGISIIPASERGHVAYVRAVLTETNINVNHINNLGWTALLEAIILGNGGQSHQEIVKILLSAGANPHQPDNKGVAPLEHANRLGHTKIATLLKAALQNT